MKSLRNNNKITFEGHKIYGKMFKEMNNIIIYLITLSNIDTNSNIKISRRLKTMSTLRSELEEIMFIDYPDKADTNIYYGEREDIIIKSRRKI